MRTIQLEEKLRRMAQMQPLRQLMADIRRRVQQPLHGPLGFRVVSLYYNENPRRPAVARKLHLAHIDQADAGIA